MLRNFTYSIPNIEIKETILKAKILYQWIGCISRSKKSMYARAESA